MSELQADIEGAIEGLKYYASLATTSLGHYVKFEDGHFAYVTKEPYGIVAGVVFIRVTCVPRVVQSKFTKNCELTRTLRFGPVIN